MPNEYRQIRATQKMKNEPRLINLPKIMIKRNNKERLLGDFVS